MCIGDEKAQASIHDAIPAFRPPIICEGGRWFVEFLEAILSPFRRNGNKLLAATWAISRKTKENRCLDHSMSNSMVAPVCDAIRHI